MTTSSSTPDSSVPSAGPRSLAAGPEGLAANRTLRPARPQGRTVPASSARPESSARASARPVASATVVVTHESRARAARRGALRARLRLLGVVFLGLVAAAVVTVVAAAFGAVAWAVPVAAVVLAGIDLLLVKGIRRNLAAGERVVRREESVTKIVGARTEPREAAPRTVARSAAAPAAEAARADVVVEAPESARGEAEAVEGLEVAASAKADDAAAEAPESKPAPKSSVVWSPVPVPKPQYVNAAKAERAEPAALVVDASVRDKVVVPAAELEAVAREWVEAPGKRPEVEDVRPVRVNKTAAAVNNLNDVLQRRRAVGE